MVGVGLSVIAVALFLAAGEKGFEANSMTLTGLIGMYCVGGLCIGAVGGALAPLMRSTVGFTVGAAFLGVLTYIAYLVQDSGPLVWRHFEWPLGIVFAIIGISAGFYARARIRSGAG